MEPASGWQLSGQAAEAYESYIVQPFMAGWAYALVEAAAIAWGSRVLDVACGTGVVTWLAADRVGSEGMVVGADLNASMLATARTLPPPPAAARIEWWQGNATDLPWPDATFDRVLCQQGLQYFADPLGALQAMRRVLGPAGRLLLSVWRRIERCPWQQALVQALEHQGLIDTAASLRAPFALGDAEAVRALCTRAGFRTVHLRIESRLTRYPALEVLVPGFLAATPAAEAIAALDPTTRTTLFSEVITRVRSYVDDDGLAVPMEAHVVVAET
ncbi:MAG TPA: class I SAM-dependent methyltransferase [Candidatus Tectomicrobia bacterium]